MTMLHKNEIEYLYNSAFTWYTSGRKWYFKFGA